MPSFLDFMAGIMFIVWTWGTLVLSWSFMVKCMDLFLDEIDLYYERKYPNV
jgi:hypothetical protein